MKKFFLLGVMLLSAFGIKAQLQMGGWKMHSAYGQVSKVENGINKVFAVSYGSLMSVDKEDGQMEYYNKLTGLSSSNIVNMRYDKAGKRLIIVYADGNVDFLYENGDIVNLIDLYSSQTGENKLANDMLLHGKSMYLAMNFGLLEFDLQRRILKDTYYIGEEASSVEVKYLAVCADTLFALSADKLYSVGLSQNKIDYHNWRTFDLPGSGAVNGLHSVRDTLYLLRNKRLYRRDALAWIPCMADSAFNSISNIQQDLTLLADSGMFVLTSDSTAEHYPYFYGATDVTFDAASRTYWYAAGEDGVGTLNVQKHEWNVFKPNGPIVNTPYRMRITDKRLYVVPGGYWTGKNFNPFAIMIYDNGEWTNYASSFFSQSVGKEGFDCVDIIADPKNPEHFFVAVLGAGIIEINNDTLVAWYNNENSPFVGGSAKPDVRSTWVDGFAMDDNGNLWMVNIGGGIYVLTKDKKWILYKNSTTLNLQRSKQFLISNQNPNIKIFMNNHHTRLGIGVLDDNGTIDNFDDDKMVYKSHFYDQNGKEVLYEAIYNVVQDVNGELWVGTNAGLFIIPDVEKIFSSDECRRVIIPRTDGSGLADYLLGEEQINAITIDGANRKWIGTQTSGVFLMSPDGTETIEHFTMDNSPLPENSILSIAITPSNGEVFIGTGMGLVSYQSNAAAPEPDIPNENLYVYPNPVREDFTGVITITGLRDNTTVKITDSAGMLVAETVSLGSLATWDGKDMTGNHVRTGVYLAQCVSADGSQYALTKILIVH